MGLEFRVATNFYIGVHARYAAFGFLYNRLLSSNAEDENNYVSAIEIDPASFGAGLEFKYYITFTSSPNMLYFGMFVEYIRGGYTAFDESYDDNYRNRIQDPIHETEHHSVGMGTTIGHRWRLGENKKVLLTIGLITGVAVPFVNTKTILETGKEYDMPRDAEFIIMAEVGIGYGM
jgi:hypothetical protein